MRVRKCVFQILTVISAAALSLPLTPTSTRAQGLPLAQVLPDLILRDIVLQRGSAGPPHEAHFSPLTNELNNPVVGIVQSFNTQMATSVARCAEPDASTSSARPLSIQAPLIFPRRS